MPVYAIAQLTITDRASYNRYLSRFLAVFNCYQGRLLAADESPAVVGGKWNHQKVVLMSIPDEPSFRLWATSPEYREISKDRHAASNAVVLLVKGISATG
jgi:uncharacterized protein (DUF1330 family)